MDKKQIAKSNAYVAVAAVLSANESDVASVKALSDASDKLTEHNLEIDTHAKTQASTSGASEAKQDALVKMADGALEIAAAVHAYAEAEEDFELAGRVAFSRTALLKGSGATVAARCRGIVDATAEHLAALADNGVTTAKFNALKLAVKSFDGVRTLPRQSKTSRSTATKQLKRLFPKVDRLLAKRMDKLVLQFKSTKPAFYDRYKAARSIVQAGAHNGKVVELPVATVPVPLAKAA